MSSSTYYGKTTGLPSSPRSPIAKKKKVVVDLPSSTAGTSMAPPSSLNNSDLNDNSNNAEADDDKTDDKKSLTSSSNHRSTSGMTTSGSSVGSFLTFIIFICYQLKDVWLLVQCISLAQKHH